ncbi:DUF3182 family protein [Pseudomonas sp. RIT-PI-AD]|uniref:DUF3182 family protein n=1 Tax=Pseudomonas sp. RIT-PI-AD TaxID=3035294 RepID=UPI0021DADC05|nr:DUF3182 family protein [Pseudomonas sp. RIT-PI-AD]
MAGRKDPALAKRATEAGPAEVMRYPNRFPETEHERVSHREIGRRLAALLGVPFAGDCLPGQPGPGRCYYVPTDSLIGLEEAARLGIRDERDLFGGVVPMPFMATKAITHPLVEASAAAPRGWSAAFAERVRTSVLAGFSAFAPGDAEVAAQRLLARGPVRLKPVRATAGRGQLLIRDAAQLEGALAGLDADELAEYGVVLEEHLEQVVTYSVGQVRVGGRVASYCGTQSLTLDNQGETVYGGSELIVARGDYAAVLALGLPEPAQRAVTQAQVYDAAADACLDGFFASRRNYDVAQGYDAEGRFRSGVLEQSWRIGGASGAEVAALEAFAADPRVAAVRASTLERFGAETPAPGSAAVLYRGEDPSIGFIGKYVVVEAYENPQ